MGCNSTDHRRIFDGHIFFYAILYVTTATAFLFVNIVTQSRIFRKRKKLLFQGLFCYFAGRAAGETATDSMGTDAEIAMKYL